jgi:hypothetical protein
MISPFGIGCSRAGLWCMCGPMCGVFMSLLVHARTRQLHVLVPSVALGVVCCCRGWHLSMQCVAATASCKSGS